MLTDRQIHSEGDGLLFFFKLEAYKLFSCMSSKFENE